MEETTGELDSGTVKGRTKRGREIKERESKRIEESNRHSNYRSRNEGVMSKNGEMENKAPNEKTCSKRQGFAEQMDQLRRGGSWSIRKGRKHRKTERAEEE